MSSSQNALTVICGAFLLAATFVLCIHVQRQIDQRRTYAPDNTYWVGYCGQIKTELDTYKVDIGESWRRDLGTRERIVHIYPESLSDGSLVSITGHDYDLDGEWDYISYCGYPLRSDGKMTGANAVVRLDSGWKFEPCNGDRGFVTPFTLEQIMDATVELNLAVRHVRHDENLYHKHVWNEDQTQIIKTIDKPGLKF